MRYIVGIDEVGRGSLAGPVVVAAVLLPRSLRLRNASLGRLRDSKRLTPRKREAWFKYIKSCPEVSFALARVYPRRIEKMNISKAANLAALRALNRLSKTSNLTPKTSRIYLDGGLYLGSSKEQRANGKWNAKTIVRGDEKIKSIMIASIIAKVHRDRLMKRLAKKYPKYGFEIHKGYGTKKHFAALKKNGPSKVHRRTFV